MPLQEPVKPSPVRTGLNRLRAALVGTVVFATAGAFMLGYHSEAGRAATDPVPHVSAPYRTDQASPFSFADLVERVSPAVVTVVVEHTGPAMVSDQSDDTPFRDFFRQFGNPDMFGQGRGFGMPGQGNRQGRPDQQPRMRGEARGSGFIVSSDGYIVTNNHVVDGGSKVTVHLPDGREFQAKVVGTDKDTDVAVLKVDSPKSLPTVAFGDESKLRVGDWVVAVGIPFGLGGTVTAGIVSSKGRDIGNGPYTDYLQIDAPINQGNSGGPTFDLSGRVVGMNTAIYSPSGGSVGIGFAIPASTVESTVSQLRDHGSVSRGWLGVQIQTLTPEMASSIGTSDAKGAIVASVVPESPAAKAGLRQGDVILALNGKNVDDSRDLTRRVAVLRAGEKADFTVMRDGHRQQVSATIGKRDADQLASAERGTRATPSAERTLGLGVAPVTLKSGTTGVVVTNVDPDSEAAGKGVQSGDVIVKVGEKDVHSAADIRNSVAEARRAGRANVLLLVTGQQGDHFVSIRIG